jgi:hypothetical protein
MAVTDLLTQLEQAGCQVALEGDILKARGPLTDDLRQAIRQHKPALVALLKAREMEKQQKLEARFNEVTKALGREYPAGHFPGATRKDPTWIKN